MKTKSMNVFIKQIIQRHCWKGRIWVLFLIAHSSLLIPHCSPLSAQNIVQNFKNQLSALRTSTFNNSNANSDYVSPYYYRLVGPTTYYSSAVSDAFSLVDNSSDADLNTEINRQLTQLYVNNPELVRHYDEQFESVDLVKSKSTAQENITKEVDNVLAEDMKDPTLDAVADDVKDIGLQVEKPNFWKKTGKFGLQFTQNYFSQQWYKGGINNQSLLASIILEANYDDTKKITWQNRLTMRLGFATSPGDTCHNFLTSDDKLNLYSKLGVKAAKNWYYTASLEANTQFMPGYRVNDPKKYSNFLAPLDFYLSVGMDYKPKFENGNTLSVALLPLSYKFRYINDDDLNIHKSYKMIGKDFQQDFGSKIELQSSVKLAKDFTWKCRFYYFTSYKYAESELENDFSYQLSKYISTELYTLWRFDDNRSRDFWDHNLGYFQFKEFFTLGLNYSF